MFKLTAKPQKGESILSLRENPNGPILMCNGYIILQFRADGTIYRAGGISSEVTGLQVDYKGRAILSNNGDDNRDP